MAPTAPARIAVLDLNRIFQIWPKAIAWRRQTEQREAELGRELEQRMQDLRKVDAAKSHAATQELTEWRKTQASENFERVRRERSSLVEEIKTIVQQKAGELEYDIVLDRSQAANAGIPLVVFSSAEWDITEQVLEILQTHS